MRYILSVYLNLFICIFSLKTTCYASSLCLHTDESIQDITNHLYKINHRPKFNFNHPVEVDLAQEGNNITFKFFKSYESRYEADASITIELSNENVSEHNDVHLVLRKNKDTYNLSQVDISDVNNNTPIVLQLLLKKQNLNQPTEDLFEKKFANLIPIHQQDVVKRAYTNLDDQAKSEFDKKGKLIADIYQDYKNFNCFREELLNEKGFILSNDVDGGPTQVVLAEARGHGPTYLTPRSKTIIIEDSLYSAFSKVKLDTNGQDWLYVVSNEGQLFTYPENGIRHNYILGKYFVACAGHAIFEDGKITGINNGSGHYRPSLQQLYIVLNYYLKSGVISPKIKWIETYSSNQGKATWSIPIYELINSPLELFTKTIQSTSTWVS